MRALSCQEIWSVLLSKVITSLRIRAIISQKKCFFEFIPGRLYSEEKNRPESELFNGGRFIKINAMMGKAIKY
ncbi:hypothetical protein ACFFJN_10365 [Erwinia mallotivora]|uniref:hypothetical protein n=1 Tax=Erwinia mallotivora TaxID=69222 RepID=UPI0035EDE904